MSELVVDYVERGLWIFKYGVREFRVEIRSDGRFDWEEKGKKAYGVAISFHNVTEIIKSYCRFPTQPRS